MSSLSLFFQLQLTSGISFALIISDPKIQARKSPDPSANNSKPGLGESCDDLCIPPERIVCKNLTCVCNPTFPVHIKRTKTCLKASLLGTDCEEDLQCQFYDQNSICKKFSRDIMECSCVEDYIMREIEGLKPAKVCFPGPSITQKDIPTFLGFGLGLSMLSALICLVLRIFARARFARPRRYANAAIPPPLTVSETYAAFALAAAESARSSPANARPQSFRSSSSSRRTSYASIHHQRAGDLLRLTSASSLSHHRPVSRRPSMSSVRSYQSKNISILCLMLNIVTIIIIFNSVVSRRPSMSSVRSYRSQSGLILPERMERDHYILYMIRGPAHSLTSDTTTSTTCDSTSPRTPKSAEQILAVYHAVPEHSLLDFAGTGQGGVGPSHTTSTFKTMSSEDVFQEEEEEEMDTEEEDEEEEEIEVEEDQSNKEIIFYEKSEEEQKEKIEEIERDKICDKEELKEEDTKTKSNEKNKGNGTKNGKKRKGL
ncbi:UNVERIFIED_CONTAM: hypothetical protein RMT77_007137 [Armadillidium vulgare]